MAVRCTNRRNQTQSLFKSLIRQLSNVYASLFHTNGRQNGCKDRVRLPPCDSPPAKQHFDTRRLSGIGICWNGKRNRVLGRVQKIAVREGSCRWRFLVACNKPVHDEKQKNSERRKEKNRERRKKRNRERREREREGGREKERDGRRLGATEPFQRTILFADTHVQRERSFFGVSDSNRVLLPDSDVLEGAWKFCTCQRRNRVDDKVPWEGDVKGSERW